MVGKRVIGRVSGDRRIKIIRAAYSEIAQKGFEGLRLRNVARKAGIDHSTLHHHFSTKRELVAAVLQYATKKFRPAHGPDRAPSTMLLEHLAFLGKMIATEPELHTVLREFDLHGLRDARIRTMIARSETGWRDHLATRIRVSRAHGEWPSQLSAVVGAELVIAVMKGASLNPKAAAGIIRAFQQVIVPKKERRKATRLGP